MNGFQSMFDVDADAIKTYDSVFDSSAEAAEQFDNIFGAEEDDRLMEAVAGFNEDGTELPDEDELHNTEDEIGEESTTPKNFGDGIFDDETKNAPKNDTSDMDGVIDRTSGKEGTKDVLDLDCDKCGVQDKGTANIDPEDITASSDKETSAIKKEMEEGFNLESFLMEEDLDIEGEEKHENDIDGGVQDAGNAEGLDDDAVEDIDSISDKEADSVEAKMESAGISDLDSLLEEDIPDMGTDCCDYEQLDSTDTTGLPDKKPGEGEVPNANKEFQDDLDEAFFMEADESDEGDEDDLESDDDDAVDEAFLFEEDDTLGLPEKDPGEGEVPNANEEFQDDLDEAFLFESDDEADESEKDDDEDSKDDDDDDSDSDDDSDDLDLDGEAEESEEEAEEDESDLDEAFVFESDVDNEKEVSPSVEKEAEEAQDQDDVKESAFYRFMSEDADVEAELDGVVDDEQMRDGYESAVTDHEGEEAPAEDLDESFLMEEDLEDSEIEEAIDDDVLETVENNQEEGEGSLNLDYDPVDDALFDEVVGED